MSAMYTNTIQPHLQSIAKGIFTYINSKVLGTNPVGVNQAWITARDGFNAVAISFVNTYNAQYKTATSYKNFNEAAFKQYFFDLYNIISTQSQLLSSQYSSTGYNGALNNVYNAYVTNHTKMFAPARAVIKQYGTQYAFNATTQQALLNALVEGSTYAYTVANKNLPFLNTLITTWIGYAANIRTLAESVAKNCALAADVGACVTQRVSYCLKFSTNCEIFPTSCDRSLKLSQQPIPTLATFRCNSKMVSFNTCEPSYPNMPQATSK